MKAFIQTLRNRNLLILGFSVLVSMTGSWITMMAVLSMLIFRGNGGVMQSSGIFIAGFVPVIIFSPLAGQLCDRFDRKWLMVASELLSGLAISGLVFFNEVWIIYLLLAFQSIFGSLMAPARQAVLPDLVSQEQLTHANAFMQQLVGITKILVPGLAGFLLLWVSPHLAILLDVLSYILSALILLRLPSLHPHQRLSESSENDTDSKGIWQIISQSVQLRTLFIIIVLTIFFIIGYDVLMSVFIRDEMQAEEDLFGLLISLIGLGTLVGAWILVVRKKNDNYWRDIIVGLICASLIPVGPALVSLSLPRFLEFAVLVAGSFLGGLGSGILTIQAYSLLQILSPALVLGRISGIFEGSVTAGQFVGMVLIPLVVPGFLPIGKFFFVSAAAIILLVFWLGWMLYREHGFSELSRSPVIEYSQHKPV